MRPLAQAPHDRSDQLEAQHGEDKDHSEDFTGAALSEPTFEPGEDHLHQQEVEESKCQQDEQGPRKQHWPRNGDAEENPDNSYAPNGAGRIEKTIGQSNQEIRAVSQRETE